mgnify:CR=1
ICLFNLGRQYSIYKIYHNLFPYLSSLRIACRNFKISFELGLCIKHRLYEALIDCEGVFFGKGNPRRQIDF